MDTAASTVTFIRGAVVAVIGTDHTAAGIVGKAGARSVAKIGIGAVRIGRTSTGRPIGLVGMGTGTVTITNISGTLVAVIRTGGTIGDIIGKACPESIAGIRVGTVRIQ